jgi:argininosuccinate lyase
MSSKDSTKPWGGRFKSELDPLVRDYTVSLHLDRRLALHDIAGSRAHAAMLAEQGILGPEDRDRILRALDQVEEEIRAGTFPYREDLEDIHMNIEKRLQELAGDAGARVHTGRSRNDQVALDLKLFCRELSLHWGQSLQDIQGVLVDRAEELKAELLPGWTHLQAAQPISWGHYLLAFCEMFERDRRRLGYYRDLHSVSPLGAGALAGSTLPLNPGATARALGFESAFANSYDVAGDRDFILELLQIASQIMLHVSRLAEDFVYLSSTPVGWIELPDELCTGSSMMPQKKNPDVLELARGKTALVLGHAAGMAALLKGLPSSYNRDLQQDKEHLFGAADTVTLTLQLLPRVLAGFSIRQDRIQNALQEGFLMATDVAEFLVTRGVPFRAAHERVGKLVAHCLERRIRLDQLSKQERQHFLPELEQENLDILRPDGALRRRHHAGSTGIRPVEDQIAAWRKRNQEAGR